jgi:hypothetical protein
MVPRAAHRFVDEQALAERPRIVSAGGAHGEDLLAPACQQDSLAFGVAEQHLALAHLRQRDALEQVWSAKLLLFAHRVPPLKEVTKPHSGPLYLPSESIDSFSRTRSQYPKLESRQGRRWDALHTYTVFRALFTRKQRRPGLLRNANRRRLATAINR